MSRVTLLYEQAFRAAENGVAAESQNEVDIAIRSFEEAVQIFSRLAIVESLSKRTLLNEQITDFNKRIGKLRNDSASFNSCGGNGDVIGGLYANTNPHIQAAEILVRHAQTMESESKYANTVIVDEYMKAADEYMKVLKDTSSNDGLTPHVRNKIESIIERVTYLKEKEIRGADIDHLSEDDLVVDSDAISNDHEGVYKGTHKKFHPNPNRMQKIYHDNDSTQTMYTAEEVDVLRRSSIINGRLFQPWISSDVDEIFSSTEMYADQDGFLTMSPKQLEKLDKWVRPTSYGSGHPQMVAQISPYVIVQDVVTDCSFVASLCITAAYELRFQKQLITKIIYPQDARGMPIVNPGGKYIVKLWANGVPRKVEVDDFLPLGQSGSLLCSCTTTSNELWVSIIEKAYLKVNGGYDFPGSNSGIDLFALTGWIPETLSFSDHDSSNSDIAWQRLISAHNFGDCLITIATGDMTMDETKRVGLVPSHAYAVLNVVETSTNIRLLQVKNPWNRKRWRGPYGIDDMERWTPELQKELGLDLDSARQLKDDGLFWIDYASIQRHFSALFLNWNPELFQYRYTLHKHWPLEVGPQNDTYNLGYNPQYCLVFPNAQRRKKSCSVWILLSRHVTSVERPENIQHFLTLHVYKRNKRVYYPNDAFTRGTYSNNPHTLTCLDVEMEADEGPSFTLVASQYEKISPLDYTISIFSTDEPFDLTIAPDPPTHRINLVGEWSASTAGGCPKYSTFLNNPQYQLIVQDPLSSILVTLEAPVHFAINIRLIRDGQRVGSISKKHLVAQSGEYRPGFCYIEFSNLPSGEYTIVPSTFEPNCIGSFSLQIAASSAAYQVFTLPPEGDGMIELKCVGKWNSSSGTAAGCSNYGHYLENPLYLLHLK
ncbi:Aste57867_22557 [Aphanomyces stellatus]|uniref:Aste57867_22557 protein n=1 Tax=Aphanomyces stellatus TaxID=120398 RepID=A0A485LM30_9STRA|nr:hypothetical protein As57867_022487 [Aphanomyces stellatus]VFT99216.1 Aste57867_22557 [Aphanomyces stellatus]